MRRTETRLGLRVCVTVCMYHPAYVRKGRRDVILGNRVRKVWCTAWPERPDCCRISALRPLPPSGCAHWPCLDHTRVAYFGPSLVNGTGRLVRASSITPDIRKSDSVLRFFFRGSRPPPARIQLQIVRTWRKETDFRIRPHLPRRQSRP